MQLPNHPGSHLSYCTNIHPGENWSEVFAQLKNHIPGLKHHLSPDQPFGIGLRLSAQAAEDLLEVNRLQVFKKWLKKEDLYVFTINGFPYGSFHGEKVKDDVYKPDWSSKQRYNYTSNLIDILAALLPDGIDGSISTSPITYKYWDDNPEQVVKKSTVQLAELAQKMAAILKNEGKEIHLDIEPEPDCLLENSRETIDYFQKNLLPEGGTFLMNEFQLSSVEAEKTLLTHIGVCYDTCHFALEYENPAEAIPALMDAGIRIGKTQISAALKVKLNGSESDRKKTAEQLQQFVEPVYLHQVIERQPDGALYQYRDLPDALPEIQKKKAEEWRVHFHVPIFVQEFDGLHSTQDEIVDSLRIILDGNHCRHFEIETYTWDVLPEDLKSDISDSIEREFRWVMDLVKDPHNQK
ncbi:MAG: metabolite traffic protein EboE [Balneolaceae bacterium]